MIILPRKFVDVDCSSRAVRMSGEYNLRVIRQDGTVARETGWFPNIILDSGLNRWGTGSIIVGAAIGTGTSTPTAAQTSLDAQVSYFTTAATGNANWVAQGSAPYYITYTAVYRSTLGVLNGNYSEVGIGWGTGAMFSRALILDGGGAPTTITVLSTEQLDVIYRLRVYPPDVDTSGSYTIDGVSYTVTGRSALVTTATGAPFSWQFAIIGAVSAFSGSFPSNQQRLVYNGAIGPITGQPSGAQAACDTGGVTTGSYVNNSLTMNSATTFGLTNGNVASGIRSALFRYSLGCFQYDFGTFVPKDSTKTLVLNTSTTWARRP